MADITPIISEDRRTGLEETNTGIEQKTNTDIEEANTVIEEIKTGIENTNTGIEDTNTGIEDIKTGIEETNIGTLQGPQNTISSIGSEEDVQQEAMLKKDRSRFVEEPILFSVSFIDPIQEPNDDEASDKSSIDSEESSEFEENVKAEPDFFETLGTIPEIDDISLDLSEYKWKPIKKEVSELEDVGQFVHPLTGERLEDSVEELSVAEVEVKIPLEEQIEEESVDEEGTDDDLLMLPEPEEDTQYEQKLPDDELATFFKVETKEQVTIDPIELESMERERAFLQLAENTNEFLQDLIKRVVDKCETFNPENILRNNLSKMQIMKELVEKLQFVNEEDAVRLFLNRKIVDYFRRKKVLRPILEDNPDTVAQDTTKFTEATTILDKLLNQLTEVTTITEAKLKHLQSVLIEARATADNEDKNYEELVVKTLTKRDGSEKLKNMLQKIFKDMNFKRDEISKNRMILIQRLHNLALLMEKSEKLENIGDGLSMHDFLHLQTQTQFLGKKNEERNVELNKLRTRFQCELHIMAHLKETKMMLTHTNNVEAKTLKELNAIRKEARNSFHQKKLERESIRREIARLSFQGGLLEKPDLMLGFDDTVDKLKTLRESVNQKKLKVIELERKIAEAEEKLVN